MINYTKDELGQIYCDAMNKSVSGCLSQLETMLDMDLDVVANTVFNAINTVSTIQVKELWPALNELPVDELNDFLHFATRSEDELKTKLMIVYSMKRLAAKGGQSEDY